MVVRILTDGQYRLDISDPQVVAAIARLDAELQRELDTKDASGFHCTLEHLIAHVHHAGHVVPIEELVPSDVIVPPADMTLAETQRLLGSEA